jgi:hypothetical protein
MPDFFEYFLRLLLTIFSLRENEVVGKVDLQKSFYFAKELGLEIPFKFRWDKLGPFSYELSHVASLATNNGYLEYEGQYVLKERSFRELDILPIPERVGNFFDNLNDFISQEECNRVLFIETLASIHFLYEHSGLRSREDIFRRLGELKSERITLLEEYLDPAWDFLIENDLITSR